MTEKPEIFSATDLQDILKPHAFGKKIRYFPTIDSTNNFAKKAASGGAEEGTLIVSEEQTQGRGRWGRSWLSPPGTGIWMSLILRPDLPPSETSKLTLLAAAATAIAINKTTGLDAGIKWPNDIIVDRKKVCGILTESGVDSRHLNYVVVGIGINVNTEDFPGELKGRATSLMKCLGRKISREKVLVRTIAEFEGLYFDFNETKNFTRTLIAYREKSVTIGKRIEVTKGGRVLLADAVDITENGELLIKKEDGGIAALDSGEVSILRGSDE